MQAHDLPLIRTALNAFRRNLHMLRARGTVSIPAEDELFRFFMPGSYSSIAAEQQQLRPVSSPPH